MDGIVERLERIIKEKDFELAVLRRSFEDYKEREKELIYCLKWFVSRNFDHYLTYEEAIQKSKRVLGLDNDRKR